MKFATIRPSRRSFLKCLAGAGFVPAILPVTGSGAQPDDTYLILLGTQGGPNFNLIRGETATLLVTDNVPYLIDCGYGTFRALAEAGINFLTLPRIFLTHLHDDHVADIPALLSHQWTQGRVDPTRVYGPYGTDALVKAALEFTRANADIRYIDEQRNLRPENLFSGEDIPASGTVSQVYMDDRVRVSAIENAHFPDWAKAQMPYRALSYRFDTAERSIVFSGDTTYSENLVTLARGADVLL